MRMPSSFQRAFASALAASFLTLASHGGVLVVDPQGAPGAPVLQIAMAFAADGDVLLVRAGNYADDVVLLANNKGLTLVNDSGGPLTLPSLRIAGIPAASTFAVRGFTIAGGFVLDPGLGIPAAGIHVESSAGVLWLEDCEVSGSPGIAGDFIVTEGGPGVRVVDIGGFVAQRCTFRGGDGTGDDPTQQASAGGIGVALVDTPSLLCDCTMIGGDGGKLPSGGNPGPSSSPHGGHGIFVDAGWADLAGCAATGGDVIAPGGVVNSFAGGGVFAQSAFVLARDSTFASGVNHVVPGNVHAPIGVVGGGIVQSATPARSIAVSSPVRTGQTATLTVDAVPGDVVVLLLAAPASPALHPGFEGSFAFLLGPFVGPLPLGTVPAGGQIVLAVPAVPLPPGIDEVTIAVQAAIASPQQTLEAASLYVQVGPNF